MTATLAEGQVLLTLRNADGSLWLTVAAWPSKTPGLYVHEHTKHDEEPGWQISSGYGVRVPGWYDTREAAMACADALVEACPDWTDLTPTTVSKAVRKRAAAVIVRYHGEARS